MSLNRFFCIDGHTCGNPVRVVAGGAPILNGENLSAKRQYFLENFDWIRKGLMFEPRGHDMMSGSMLYPASDPDNDIGILFIETSGCLPMCGHGTIGTVTFMLQEGLVSPKNPGVLKLEVPAGVVTAEYKEKNGRVESVKITNVASFLAEKDLTVDCPDLGKLTLDVAYGGNFYAIIDPQENYTGLQAYKAEQLIGWSRDIRRQLNERHQFVHPSDDRIRGLSHVMWTGETIHSDSTARNAVFYGDKAIDRSPCGTGTSARMAQWAAKGKLKVGEEFIHESIIGSRFIGKIEQPTTINGIQAIIPSIRGWARVTGYNTITIDDDDPYAHGFQVL